MANYMRGPRDELIRRLHRQEGLSIRQLRTHPKVLAANGGRPASLGCVHRAIHAGDADDGGDELGRGGDDAFHAVSVAVGSSDDDGTVTDAELLDELYMPDGRPNALTLHRLRYGDGYELTPAQGVMVREAEDAADRLLSPEERERRRWQFRGPRMRHENHGTFTAARESGLGMWHEANGPGRGRVVTLRAVFRTIGQVPGGTARRRRWPPRRSGCNVAGMAIRSGWPGRPDDPPARSSRAASRGGILSTKRALCGAMRRDMVCILSARPGTHVPKTYSELR